MSAAASFGYALAPSWSVIVGIGALAGFGSGVLDAGLNTYLAAEYKESEMQWLHACFGIGATLSPIIMTISLSQWVSWRPAYILVGLVMAVMTGLFWITYSAWKVPRTTEKAFCWPSRTTSSFTVFPGACDEM